MSDVGHRGHGWFVFKYRYSTKRSAARDEIPTRGSQTIDTKNIMLTVIWDSRISCRLYEGTLGHFKPSTFLLTLEIVCWRKSLRRKGKAVHFD
jgi:hypothetical protein